MVIAFTTFFIGLLIGLYRGIYTIIAASIMVSVGSWTFWIIADHVSLSKTFVCFGYLLALHSGFLVGGYIRTYRDH
jgi:hypothetical protein